MAGIDNNTKLCIHFNGPDGSKEVIDSGNTGHIVTQNGNATLIRKQRIGVGACYFDGSGDYLTTPYHTDWNFGTDDFTIELWTYWINTSDQKTLIEIGDGFEVSFYWYAGYLYFGLMLNNTSGQRAWTPSVNTWYHLVMVRYSGNIYFYVDGVQVGTSMSGSSNIVVSTKGVYIGARSYNGYAGTSPFYGYFDEVRISNTARWTANFTPLTKAYTSDSYTKLLLHFENNLTDSGNTGHTVTANGDAHIEGCKFGNACAYFVRSNSQYLSIPDSADWDVGTSSFTIECWVMFKSVGNDMTFVDVGGYGNGIRLSMGGPSGDMLQCYINGDNLIRWAWVPVINTWYHVAVVRSGTTVYGFINGVVQGTTFTKSDNIQTTDGVQIGKAIGLSQYFDGYLDEIRFSNAARWTTTFTLPTSAYISDSYTKLLLHLNSQDESPFSKIPTFVATAQIDTAQKKWGSGALLGDGNSDYVWFPDDNDWHILQDNITSYTVDLWVKFNNTSGYRFFLHQGTSEDGWQFYQNYSGNQIYFDSRESGGSAFTMAYSGRITDSNWHHLAVVIIGNGSQKTVGMYLDGTQIGYATSAVNITYVDKLYIGACSWGNYFDGWIDEVRIQHSNIFNASPNSGKTNTITVPTAEYSSGYANKVIGISNIAKVNGVENIAKLIGV